MPKAPELRILGLNGGKWFPQDRELDELLQWPQTPTSWLVFLQAEDFVPTTDLAARLEQRVGAPEILWSDLCTRHNGFFGHEDDRDDQGTLVGHRTWFRFQIKCVGDLLQGFPVSYSWHSFTFFVRWRAPNTHQILCFDVEPEFQCKIVQRLNSIGLSEHDYGYQTHSVLTSVVLQDFDASVWSLRDWIRYIEQNRMKDHRSPETDYYLLHELARHACHSSETAAVAINTLSQMSLHHKSHFDEPNAERKSTPPAQPDIDFQISLLRGIHARSSACERRLSNETNLAINLVAQEESRATVSISQATQSDSAAMKVVAVVTLLFLPSTFVSTIFSMTFFSYNPGSNGGSQVWQVSGMIWLYFVFTVPLTVVAVCSWIWWQRKYSRQAEQRLRHVAPATSWQLPLPR